MTSHQQRRIRFSSASQLRLALALAALSLVVAGCTDDGGAATGSDPSQSRTPGPTPAFTLVDPEADGSISLPAGRYALTADGSDSSPLAVMDVPDGFHGFGGWSLGADGGPNNQDFYGVSYHAVDAVPEDGCTRDSAPTDAGTSPEDLAAALEAQKMTSITAPEPISLAGHDGLYLELTASQRIRPKTCTDRTFELWSSGSDGRWLLFEPGQVDQLWILDVDGQTLVLDARSVPGVTPDQVDAITGIVGSVRFANPN
jgi:hypothetical protein